MQGAHLVILRRMIQIQAKFRPSSITTYLNKELTSSPWSFKFSEKSNSGVKPIDKAVKESQQPAKSLNKWCSYPLPRHQQQTFRGQKFNTDNVDDNKSLKETSEAIGDGEITSPSYITKLGGKFKQTRKLRPRKSIITLSATAIQHLKPLLNQPVPKMVRIGVRNRGCSGLTYDLHYITEPGEYDEIVEQDGVTVVIDSKALFSIVGSEMDWIDDELSSRFVFKNPNSKGTCGCGESFMV